MQSAPLTSRRRVASLAAMRPVNPYKLLDLPRDATDDQIRTAWREATKKWHPDRCEWPEFAKVICPEINQAAETLLDPTRRAKRDAELDAELATERLLAAMRAVPRRRARRVAATPPPQPKPGLLAQMANDYARAQGMEALPRALLIMLGIAADREFGTDRLQQPPRG